MTVVLYAGAMGLLIGWGGGVFAALAGGLGILAAALLALLLAPAGALPLALETGAALAAYNALLLLALSGRFVRQLQQPGA